MAEAQRRATRAHRERTKRRRLLAGSTERTLIDDLACELPDGLVDEALARPRDLGRKFAL